MIGAARELPSGGAGFSAAEIARATGARLVRGDPSAQVAGVSTDTRSPLAGRLFVALSGEHFDGNEFASAAVEAGAAAVLLAREPASPLPAPVPVLVHCDPRIALGRLAAWHRARLSAPVIAITGSAGKTTTKNLLVQLLAPRARVVGSEKSFNNDIGVPLTLLAAGEDCQALVVELGTNAPGEIEALCRIARPTVGVVTGVGHAHLERLGSLEGVAREKGALPAALPPDGDCVLNADCRFAEYLSSRTQARVSTYSVGGPADLVAEDLVFHAAGTSFRLRGIEVASPLLGTHNVHDLLAALLVCERLGHPLEDLLPCVARLHGGTQRLERREIGGLVVIDDSYNANPESARAAVRVLAGQHGFARRVLVLGDMLELGALGPELHHALGREAAAAGLDLVVLVGDLSRAAAAGALEHGMRPAQVAHFATVELAREELGSLLRRGDVVLFKASRRMAFERLVARVGEVFPSGAAPGAGGAGPGGTGGGSRRPQELCAS